MNMELRRRETITQPKRFEDEADRLGYKSKYKPTDPYWVVPSVTPPPFVDYNPNLPPAAFPTLSHPRPPTTATSQNQNTNTSWASAKQPTCLEPLETPVVVPICSVNDRYINPMLIRPTDMSMSEWRASNGPQNPVWQSNMAILAGRGTAHDDDFLNLLSDSDEEIETVQLLDTAVSKH